MSTGYGGNLTYPSLKQFTNTNLNAEGKTAFTGFSDKRYTSDGNYTQFISEQIGMGSIPFIAGKSSWEIVWGQPSVAKQTKVHLNDDMTCSPCPYDFGFGVKTIAKKPGVLNSLFYGKIRPYYSSTNFVTDDGAGHIAADDHIRMNQEILDLILADTGLGNHDDEHKGAVVDASMSVGLNKLLSDTKFIISIPSIGFSKEVTFTATAALKVKELNAILGNVIIKPAIPGPSPIPAITLLNYMKAMDADGDSASEHPAVELDSYVDGEYAVNSDGAAGDVLATPAGFTMKELGGTSATIVLGRDNYLWLITKPKFQDIYSFVVEHLTEGGMFNDFEKGNFATMTSDDVFRQFAHRRNDRGFANMWRQEKPTDFPTSGPVQGTAPIDPTHPDYAPITTGWYKLILTTDMGTAAIHGASHGDSYRQQMELYMPEIPWKTKPTTSTGYAYLHALAKWWSTTPPATLPIW